MTNSQGTEKRMIRVKNPQDFWAGLLFLVVGMPGALVRT